jgi:asparagine synthase (glutamine-hydrolysing)
VYRYLALVWDPLSVASARTLESFNLAASLPQHWSVTYQGPGILTLHSSREPPAARSYVLEGRRGVILGKLFKRRCSDYSRQREVTFDELRSAKLVRSGAQLLIDEYWGSYLAIVRDEQANSHHILRDPVGTLPCYHLTHAGIDIFFSHVADCVHMLPLSLSVNRRHLSNWLFYSTVSSEATGLENVTQLPRGERLTLSPSGVVRSRVWDPTAIAGVTCHEQPAAAARELRATVQTSIDAWASCYQKITHRLSGGLDSAIVAGCLAQSSAKAQVTYLNLAVEGRIDDKRYQLPGMDARTAAKMRAIAGHGDERYFARLVAERWRIPLIERRRDPLLDLARLRQAPLTASPAMYFSMVEMDDAELEMTASHGTQAFFSGQAGDSVFLGTTQPLAAMDHAYLHGVCAESWRQVVASTALSKESLWSVLHKTISHGLLRRPYSGRTRLLNRPTLLAEALVRSLRAEELESGLAKLAAHSRLPPGKRNLIKGIPCNYHEFVFHAGDHADHIDPLNSQPVWELMLQIPTHTILMDGVSRGLARHAFADLLPDEIRQRQVKGTGSYFYQDLLRRNRSVLSERLLDGMLVREGYLDRRKLLDCLARAEPFLVIPAATLLAYLAAEIWLEQWSAIERNFNAERAARRRTAAF